MNSNRTVIIYRDELLGSSETFIRAQAESLRQFRPFYLGLRNLPGLELPKDSTYILSGNGWRGKLERAWFRSNGPSASLIRRLTRLRPALVHAHFGPDACNALPIASALRVPLLATFHGYDATLRDEFLSPRYLRNRESLQQKANRFISVSNFIRGRLISQGFPEEKTEVHYTGVDTAFFSPNARVPRQPLVLFVGRLVPKKGCHFLIRAMALVERVMPEASLVVIGDGPLREDLERQAASMLRNFTFRGMQKPKVVRYWMNRAKVLSTPSIVAESGDAEGFGMVFAEAQAMGLPVVSFDTASLPEVVADGETGFLVREGDSDTLAARILQLLKRPEMWASFSRAGQGRARSLFNLSRQAPKLEEIYDRLLEGSGSRGSSPARPEVARAVLA